MSRILPAVLIIVAIGIFFGYTSPTFTGPVAEAQTKIKSFDSALEASKEFKSREEELGVERSKLSSEGLNRLEAFLPDNVNNIQLILDLDALAARSGVRLSNFSIGDQTSEGESVEPGNSGALSLKSDEVLGSIDLSVTATGTYTAFQSFLRATEQSLRLLDITSITVTSKPTGIYTYDVVFRIYWLQ